MPILVIMLKSSLLIVEVNWNEDILTPHGFVKHLLSVLSLAVCGLLSTAPVCGTWTLINRYLVCYSYHQFVQHIEASSILCNYNINTCHAVFCTVEVEHQEGVRNVLWDGCGGPIYISCYLTRVFRVSILQDFFPIMTLLLTVSIKPNRRLGMFRACRLPI